MDDKEYFYSKYKEAALRFQDELPHRVNHQIRTFPENDVMRKETIRFVREGGKRLRTVLAKVVTEFYGVDDGGASGMLDTFHKFLLVHDDIMDKDRLRWGKPTVHAVLEDLIDNAHEKEHFGNGLGIVSGDLIAAMSYRFVLESPLPSDIKVNLMKLACTCMDEVAWGWYDQLRMDYESLDSDTLSFERIKDSVIWVTGKYTISFPLRFGYTIVNKEMPRLLEEIADDLGVLFQTGDDVIGIFGDSEKSGKSNYGDIVQGKKTLPMWFAYERSTAAQKKRLVELVGKKDITLEEVEEVRGIMRENGSVEYIRTFMHDYATRINEKLTTIDLPEEMARFMRGFTLYLVDRES